MDLLSTTEDSRLCNSMLRDLLSARERLRLEREERATDKCQAYLTVSVASYVAAVHVTSKSLNSIHNTQGSGAYPG